MTRAIIVLEDGTAFTGRSFGAEGEKIGEVIFNTQIIGYQEILTDPAYLNQIVCFGYPHIGNYGINDRLFESDTTHALALIVKEYSKIYSNWQATGSLGDFMEKYGVMGIEGVDTRALTTHIRDRGEMKAVVSTLTFDVKELVTKAKNFQCPTSKFKTTREIPGSKAQTVIINIGANKSLLALYKGATMVGADLTAEKILALDPEEVIITSGPGDPRLMIALVTEVKKMVGKVRLIGYQNGACILALALGGVVGRMKVGHHGMNIPVVEPKSGKGEITMQNHSFGITALGDKLEIVHKNLNDESVEAFKTKQGDCLGLLYSPIDQRGKLPQGYKLV